MSTLPENAPALFTAGVIEGMIPDLDVKDLLLECFKPDPEFAEMADNMMVALKEKDVPKVQDLMFQLTPKAFEDAEPCGQDDKFAKVSQAAARQGKLFKLVADEGPMASMRAMRSVTQHTKEFRKNVSRAGDKWGKGKYYSAGLEIGTMNKLIFEPWEKEMLEAE